MSAKIHQHILLAYPNPNRNGCPETDVLAEIAYGDDDLKRQYLPHITHCSPCYRDYLFARRRSRQKRIWPWVIAAAFIIAALIAAHFSS